MHSIRTAETHQTVANIELEDNRTFGGPLKKKTPGGDYQHLSINKPTSHTASQNTISEVHSASGRKNSLPPMNLHQSSGYIDTNNSSQRVSKHDFRQPKMSKMPSPFKISPDKLSLTTKKKSLSGIKRVQDRFNRADLKPSFFDKNTPGATSELKRVEDIGQIEIINQQRMAQQHSQAMVGSNYSGRNDQSEDYITIPTYRQEEAYLLSPAK